MGKEESIDEIAQRLKNNIVLWDKNIKGLQGNFHYEFKDGVSTMKLYLPKEYDIYKPALKKKADEIVNDAMKYIKCVYERYTTNELMLDSLKENMNQDLTDYMNVLLRNGMSDFILLIQDKIAEPSLKAMLQSLKFENLSWRIGDKKIEVGTFQNCLEALMNGVY